MLRVNLKRLLDECGLTAYQLAQAVEELDNQTIFAYVRGNRKPSMKGLDCVITALRELTNLPITVSDVLEYIPDQTVAAQEPSTTPTLIGPEGVIHDNHPKLRLYPVEGANRYAFFLRGIRSESYLLNNIVSPNPHYHPPPKIFIPGERYLWTAKAHTAKGWSSAATPLIFIVLTDSNFETSLTKPSPPQVRLGLDENTTTPTLSVEPSDHANWYGFYVRDITTDELVYDNDYAAEPSVIIPAGLLTPGHDFRWNARVRNAAGWSEFCERSYFRLSTSATVTVLNVQPLPQLVLGKLYVSDEPQAFLVTGNRFIPGLHIDVTAPDGMSWTLPRGVVVFKGKGALELTTTLAIAGTWQLRAFTPDGIAGPQISFEVFS